MFFVDSANFVSMKRLFLSLLACLMFACLAEAQRTHDTIYLKNGSVLYGQIIEELPDTQVKIRLRDGSLLICPYSDLERIEYSTGRASFYEEPRTPYLNWHFDAGYLFGPSERQHIGAFVSYGARFSRALFLGLGSGVMCDMAKSADLVIPIYGHLRAYLPIHGPIKPFVDLRPGYSFTLVNRFSGFYGSAVVGLDLWRFTCGVGVSTVRNSSSDDPLLDREPIPYRATGFILRIGMTL